MFNTRLRWCPKINFTSEDTVGKEGKFLMMYFDFNKSIFYCIFDQIFWIDE